MLSTCEFVSPKHPDKLCDTLADILLDEYLKQDPQSRVAIEVLGGHGVITLSGEVTSKATVDVEKVTKNFLGQELKAQSFITQQSKFIAQGVDTGGAGDQGIMYGYATDETPEFMPYEYMQVRNLCAKLYELYPHDGKVQITFADRTPTAVVASFQNSKSDELHQAVQKLIEAKEYLINPAGEWNEGGFSADTGLTGRKLAIDNYGTTIPLGGGAFSGKDSTKVDRSAAYMARFVAKNIVANGLARQCLVSVAYAIGKVEPVMVEAMNEKGESIANLIKEKFDFRPQAIIERLGLRQPIFAPTAPSGHFGKPGLPWEQVIKV